MLLALTERDGEARRYDGEDIFASVQTDRADETMEPEMRLLEAEFWNTLWTAAHGDPAAVPFMDMFPDWCA